MEMKLMDKNLFRFHFFSASRLQFKNGAITRIVTSGTIQIDF